MGGDRSRHTKVKGINKGGAGAPYGLGFLGAVVHYLQAAATFWLGVLGIVKALVWPAFLAHGLLELLQA